LCTSGRLIIAEKSGRCLTSIRGMRRKKLKDSSEEKSHVSAISKLNNYRAMSVTFKILEYLITFGLWELKTVVLAGLKGVRLFQTIILSSSFSCKASSCSY
jgi:hypothetical protein